MSLSIDNSRRLVQAMNSPEIRNLIAQSKAKQVLREVREIPTNFPNFDPQLDDRVTFVAYGLLAAGCSLIERGESAEGYAELYAVGDALESAHRTESANQQASALHCLIGAMAFLVTKPVQPISPAPGNWPIRHVGEFETAVAKLVPYVLQTVWAEGTGAAMDKDAHIARR